MTLAVAAMVATAACSDGGGLPGGSDGAAPVRQTTTTADPLTPAVPWTPPAGETELELKRAASSFVQTLTTYEATDDPVVAASERLQAAGFDPALAQPAKPLLVALARSRGDVIYPQFGGLTPTAASAMVVVRQRRDNGERVTSETRTLDVRLTRREGRWGVEGLASVGGDPVPRPADLDQLWAKVIDNPRIDLPDSARWDVFGRRIDTRVAGVLDRLAQKHKLRVAVLSSGHPMQVFATTQVSNHIPGRGVDIWDVDGPVTDQRGPTSGLPALLRDAIASGVTEAGGPFDVDGPGGASFTNAVHADHLHLAFDR